MKKITLLSQKAILILKIAFFIGTYCSNAQTTLGLGDIAIVGYNADETTEEDQFSFILLTDITSGTTINFTDFGWCSGVDITGFQTPNPCGVNTGALSDGAITWTATSDLSCGTQIKVICGGTSLSATSGTVTGLYAMYNTPTEYMSLATGGDQIFAFQGTLASPTLITGIDMHDDAGWDATLSQCTFSSSISSKPAVLDASNSISITPEVDNAIYNCTITNDIPANLRTAIFNVSNWNVDNTNAFTMPLSCTFGCATLSVDSFNLASRFSIYPNPASDILNIKVDRSIELNKVIIYSSLGSILKTGMSQDIDLRNLSKGIYYLRIETNLGNATKHFVIEEF